MITYTLQAAKAKQDYLELAKELIESTLIAIGIFLALTVLPVILALAV